MQFKNLFWWVIGAVMLDSIIGFPIFGLFIVSGILVLPITNFRLGMLAGALLLMQLQYFTSTWLIVWVGLIHFLTQSINANRLFASRSQKAIQLIIWFSLIGISWWLTGKP